MDKEIQIARMKELSFKLKEASRAYYQQDNEIMSNFEYDKMYDELIALEESTGIVLPNSPTVTVGYESVDSLPKETHDSPMLSLDKTKDREELKSWLNGHEALLSWKLDGLTIVLTYENGLLSKAVTRGNGEVGEIVTNNARTFINLPHRIPYTGKLVLRGEAVISYSDFKSINESIADEDAKYKNPRNLCSGSVRQLSNEITAKRKVRLYAFSLVSCESVDFNNSRDAQMKFLKEQGFEVVEYHLVTNDTILDRIEYYYNAISSNDVPSDGLVLTYEDIAYGQSLGRTAKFPRDAIAFKWADETAVTVLREIEWSPSRTGLINPVAIFDPVELEGTTVSRASVHNLSIMEGLELGIGDSITVYKANMIIPQIGENLTRSNNMILPEKCPACGEKTDIANDNGTKTLICSNPECPAKQIKSLSLFVSRDAMQIDGMSEATLEKLVAHGMIWEYADIYHLDRYEEEIKALEGFGGKSYDNMIESINASRHTTLNRVLYAIGIAGIGVANAKILARYFKNDLEAIRNATIEELSEIDKIGSVMATAIYNYFRTGKTSDALDRLVAELIFEEEDIDESAMTLNGKTFVITGSLNRFENRNELKDIIEKKGGKVAGSVSSKTDALINNDVTSSSSKNKKARELGIKILSEDDFINDFLSDLG